MVNILRSFLKKEKMNGTSRPGTMTDPRVYHISTTEGMLSASINDIKTDTNNPFLTRGIAWFSLNVFLSELTCTLHSMSLPKVEALIKV